MAEQPRLFDIGSLNPHQFPPVPAAQEGAAQYTGGRHQVEGLEEQLNRRRQQQRIGFTYAQKQDEPESPNIRRSYKAFRNDINKQYDFMTKPREQGGMGIKHEVVHHDPYNADDPSGLHAMRNDIEGGRIRTLASDTTGSHNFLSNEENDRFRATHDVFGHAATGHGFDAQGEEVAYLSHRQMFSRQAQQALASETRGQNTYMNYGPGGFPEQSHKLIGLPNFASRVRRPRK